MRVNFLSNHWLCSAILLATTNWARYKEKEKDKERKLRKLHCTNSCFFAKIDIFKLFAVHVSFILSLGTGTYGDVGPYVQQVLKDFPFFTFSFSVDLEDYLYFLWIRGFFPKFLGLPGFLCPFNRHWEQFYQGQFDVNEKDVHFTTTRFLVDFILFTGSNNQFRNYESLIVTIF